MKRTQFFCLLPLKCYWTVHWVIVNGCGMGYHGSLYVETQMCFCSSISVYGRLQTMFKKCLELEKKCSLLLRYQDKGVRQQSVPDF